MSGWRPFNHEFSTNDVCTHCCVPNLNGCEARLTPQEWFSYQVWNTTALDRFKVNMKELGGVNLLNICQVGDALSGRATVRTGAGMSTC